MRSVWVSWYVTNMVLRQDLQITSVKEEIHRFSTQYRALIYTIPTTSQFTSRYHQTTVDWYDICPPDFICKCSLLTLVLKYKYSSPKPDQAPNLITMKGHYWGPLLKPWHPTITPISECVYKAKKAIHVTSNGGLKGCEMLRIPHCLDQCFPTFLMPRTPCSECCFAAAPIKSKMKISCILHT
jgi:hypothetical protein